MKWRLQSRVSSERFAKKCEHLRSYFAIFFAKFRIFSRNEGIKNAKMKWNFCIIFFSKFSHFVFFAKIMLFLWSKFKRNFAKKAKIFAFFVSERNAKKCEIFAKLFSFFAGNPTMVPLNLSLFRTILTGGRLDESGTEVWGQGLYPVGLFR